MPLYLQYSTGAFNLKLGLMLLLCQIADEHKAVLLADIAHISGLVAAQVSEISSFLKKYYYLSCKTSHVLLLLVLERLSPTCI